MNLGLNLRAVVVKDVEDEMTLMVVSGDIASVYRDVVGDQRVGHDAFLQPEVFGGMASVEAARTSLKFLAVTAGMQEPADVVMAEDRKPRDLVTHHVIGLPQGLGTQEIIRGG